MVRIYGTHKKRKRYKDRRITAARRIYARTRWRKYRKYFIMKNKWCVECQRAGRLTPATDVDHIVPFDGVDMKSFWNKSNHQPLCKTCHSIKTGKEKQNG
jgi:5-methylcytosine-specific restriction protein A